MGSSKSISKSAHIINDTTHYSNLFTDNYHVKIYSLEKRSKIPLMEYLSEEDTKKLEIT